MISRRQFLGTGVLPIIAAATGGLEQIISSSAHKAEANNGVNLAQAVSDKDNKHGYRQKYLKQLVEKIGLPEYVESVEYDHNKSLSKNELRGIALDISLNLRVQGNAKGFYYAVLENDPRFKNLEHEEKKAKIWGFLDTEQGLKEAQYYFKQRQWEALLSSIGGSSASTLNNPLEFGQRKKSKIVFYDLIFEGLEKETENGRKRAPVTDDYIKSALIHEYVHAEHHYTGIHSERVFVNRHNFWLLNSDVLNILEETLAYLRQLDYIGGIQQNHPSRVIVLHAFAKKLADNPFVLSQKKLLGDNGIVIDYVNELIKQKVPEVFQLIDFYKPK